MNFFDVKDFFKKLYPEKDILLKFDENCIRKIEMIYNEGTINPVHHLEYSHVRVEIDGIAPQYVKIQSHREICNIDYLVEHFNNHILPRYAKIKANLE